MTDRIEEPAPGRPGKDPPWQRSLGSKFAQFRQNALAGVLGVGIGALVFGYVVYTQFRIEVPPEHVAVLTHRTGLELANDDVVAPTEQHKGVQKEVLTEGRYFYNPYNWAWTIVPMQVVPQGKVGVLVRLFGRDLEAGRILANEPDQKGIVRSELRPGRYPEFSNPFAYKVELHDAVTVPPGYRGVVTIVAGDRSPSKPNALVVESGERGVQPETIPEGTHYVNPYVQRIGLVDCRQKTLSLNEEQDMGFPSKDGFWVRLDGFVRFRLNDKKVQELFVIYNDDANGDELSRELSEKVILPNARSFCRLTGASYSGRDLVDGKTREMFQKAFEQKMISVCKPLGIEVEAASITEIFPPQPIMDQLNRREIAHQQKQQFLREIEEQKSQAKLAIQKMLKEQQGRLILAEQEVIQLKTKADQEKQVALTKASEQLAVAQQRFQASQDKADAIKSKGLAEAEVVRAKNVAEAAGLKSAVQAFNGNGNLYAQRTLLEKLAPRYQQLMVNSADSPLMKIFDKFNAAPATRGSATQNASTQVAGTPNAGDKIAPAKTAAAAKGDKQ